MRRLAPILLLLVAPPARAEQPLASLPYTPGLDVGAMDRSVDPCQDFYAYSCAGWQRANPVPPDRSSWGVYDKVADENLQYLWGLLEEAARRPDARRSPLERQVGDYFAACMDEAAVDRAGAQPLAADLAAVDGLSGTSGLAGLLGRLHQRVEGNGLLFGFGSQQSFEDAEQVVAVVGAGGLGLPDRDQYLADDVPTRTLREGYQALIRRMLELSGWTAARSATGAAEVMRLETSLARASLDRVDRRNPKKVWHHATRQTLEAALPDFRWADYFEAVGTPAPAWLNLGEPAFAAEVQRLLAGEPLTTWKSYLRFHLTVAAAPYLGKAFREAHFAFYGAQLRGAKVMAPRWKRCVGWVDRDLGEALGQLFVARAFPPEAKRDAERMVQLVEAAMEVRLAGLGWMGPATRQAALQKLHAMRNKIGYPDRWRDYAALRVRRGDFAGNVARAAAFETARQLGKIGKPVDRGEWQMTPPTVNAYYDASMNDINFPAGVLLPPLWDPRIDLAPGYGNTGSTVGHELIHGFDDEGRQFDARGDLRDWWTAADAEAFETRAQCVVAQFGAYTAIDDIKINSRLTLGEDLADLAGTLLAWDAWRKATEGQKLEPRDGLTPEQRFFVGFAQWDCANQRPEESRLRALTDAHSPSRWRINGVVANMPEFARAFACPAGSPMVSRRPCLVW